MNKSRLGTVVRVTVAAACIVMAVLSGTGLVSSNVPNGRLIFGIGWLVVGAGWLARYFLGRSLEAKARDDGGSDFTRTP
jgi:hypothetical protein